MSDLIERDERVVWHPFTQRGMGGESFPVVSARGTTVSYTHLTLPTKA